MGMGTVFTAGVCVVVVTELIWKVDGVPMDATGAGDKIGGDTFALLWAACALKRGCGRGRLEVLLRLGLFELVESVVVVTDSCKRGRLSRVPSRSFSLSSSCTRLLGPIDMELPLFLMDGTAPSDICVSSSDN
jgi:hypothetical protein